MLVRRLATIPPAQGFLETLLTLSGPKRERLQHLVEALASAPPDARNRAVARIRKIGNTRQQGELDWLEAIDQVIKYLELASRAGSRRQQRVHRL